MRSVAPMRTAKVGYIILSVILCVMGGVLIAVPGFSVSLLGMVCGVILILFGAVRLIGFFSKDLYRLAFQYDLAFGVMMMVLGIMMLIHPDSLMNVICITLGVSFLADGLFKIQTALEGRRFGIRRWWLMLIMAILSGLCGGILLFQPHVSGRILMILIGLSLLFEGVLNLITAIIAVKIIKHQQPDEIWVNFDHERKG